MCCLLAGGHPNAQKPTPCPPASSQTHARRKNAYNGIMLSSAGVAGLQGCPRVRRPATTDSLHFDARQRPCCLKFIYRTEGKGKRPADLLRHKLQRSRSAEIFICCSRPCDFFPHTRNPTHKKNRKSDMQQSTCVQHGLVRRAFTVRRPKSVLFSVCTRGGSMPVFPAGGFRNFHNALPFGYRNSIGLLFGITTVILFSFLLSWQYIMKIARQSKKLFRLKSNFKKKPFQEWKGFYQRTMLKFYTASTMASALKAPFFREYWIALIS